MKNKIQSFMYRLYAALITVIPPVVACSLLFTNTFNKGAQDSGETASLSAKAVFAVAFMLVGLIANLYRSSNPKINTVKKYIVPSLYIVIIGLGVGIRILANSMIEKLIALDIGTLNYKYIAESIGLSGILDFGEAVAVVGGALILGTILSYLFQPVANLYYALSHTTDKNGITLSINAKYVPQKLAWRYAFKGIDTDQSLVEKIKQEAY